MKGDGGAASIEGLRPYEDWLRQCFYPLLNPPTKKTNLPHERFVYASGVRFKKSQLPSIWRNAFG